MRAEVVRVEDFLQQDFEMPKKQEKKISILDLGECTTEKEFKEKAKILLLELPENIHVVVYSAKQFSPQMHRLFLDIKAKMSSVRFLDYQRRIFCQKRIIRRALRKNNPKLGLPVKKSSPVKIKKLSRKGKRIDYFDDES